ncbi:hypothetical protein Bca52824_024273 [Brassica carinata]|uniref:Uncharacterized protein n=1 Tax=Brassica carinata TaxID=52824 RepID=A0A8X7VK38_BRACI|nr:hypothetical protein Bca52824_024273 [Brassica carinata]
MGFIMEFAENLVLRLMEDPEVRQESEEHIYEMHERCKKIKRCGLCLFVLMVSGRLNVTTLSFVGILRSSQVAGRRDPYDDLLRTILLLRPQTDQTVVSYLIWYHLDAAFEYMLCAAHSCICVCLLTHQMDCHEPMIHICFNYLGWSKWCESLVFALLFN